MTGILRTILLVLSGLYLLQVVLGIGPPAKIISIEDTRSSIRRLAARNSDEAPPCIVRDRCAAHSQQDYINSILDQSDRSSGWARPIEPHFEKVPASN